MLLNICGLSSIKFEQQTTTESWIEEKCWRWIPPKIVKLLGNSYEIELTVDFFKVYLLDANFKRIWILKLKWEVPIFV